MANILDYLDWRGDLTLAQDPFNEVDNLILAELSFVDFGGIVPGPGEGRAVPLWKAAEAYFAKTEGRPIDMGVLVPNQIPERLRRTAASPRFRDMKLNGFVDHLDTVKAEQFAALAAECGDGTVYLSFRGTDDTLAGWKEDFYLSCMREVPAQKMAVAYTEAMAHQTPGSSCGWAAIPRAAIWQCGRGCSVPRRCSGGSPPSGPMTAPASMTIFWLCPDISGWRSVSTPLFRNPPW